MGGAAAASSINRVMTAHADEIQADWMEQVPESLRGTVRGIVLTAQNYGIQVEWEFEKGQTLPGPMMDIDELADLYPDCHVSY